MPMPSHIWYTGQKQGAINGSCTMQGRENSSLVEAFSHDVTIPRDPQTGLSTGKRVHGPFTIVKMYDKASPLLYTALCTGEHFTSVKIKWYRIAPDGTEEHYFTHELIDGILVSIRPWMPNCLDPNTSSYQHMEECAWTYRKIIWTWEPDGIVAEDDWQVPK